MSNKRLKVYALVALGSELLAVAFALTANLTRHFDGWLNDSSKLFGGFGLVALGAGLEFIRREVSDGE